MATSNDYLIEILRTIRDMEITGSKPSMVNELISLRKLYTVALQSESMVGKPIPTQGFTCGWCHKRVKSLDHVVACRAGIQKLEAEAIETTKIQLQNLLREIED